jgi:hypothetical protein
LAFVHEAGFLLRLLTARSLLLGGLLPSALALGGLRRPLRPSACLSSLFSHLEYPLAVVRNEAPWVINTTSVGPSARMAPGFPPICKLRRVFRHYQDGQSAARNQYLSLSCPRSRPRTDPADVVVRDTGEGCGRSSV